MGDQMAISVVLQDEQCADISETVQDPQGAIALCLPNPADTTFCCLRFIDPYGDTVFNHLQAVALLEEWDRLRPSFTQHNAAPLWSDIRKLIAHCAEEPHAYLRFVGD
jgi:hypothetical protein